MPINSNIPLQSQVPNFLQTLVGADQARFQRQDMEHQNALRAFLGENGQAIYSGDQNALGGLAKFDPNMALGIRQTHQQMQHSEERLKLARAAGARAAANAKLSAEEAAKQKAEFDELRKLALLRQSDPDAFASALQMPEYAAAGVTPENFDLYLATAEGAESIFKGIQATTPEEQGPLSNLGKIQADIDAGRLPEDTPLRSGGTTLTVTPDGTVSYGTGTQPVQKLTERQSMLSLFGAMMDQTMPVINGLEERFNPANVRDAAATASGTAGNFVRSQEMQEYDAAASAWAEGVLRIQTGAAATQPEIERVRKTYFAIPGDSPETVQFKRKLREAYGRSVGIGSGGLVRPTSDIKPESPISPGGSSGSPSIGQGTLDAISEIERLLDKYGQ